MDDVLADWERAQLFVSERQGRIRDANDAGMTYISAALLVLASRIEKSEVHWADVRISKEQV